MREKSAIPLCIICREAKGCTQLGKRLRHRSDQILNCIWQCVPEMENMLRSDDYICQTCKRQINVSIQFREKCLAVQKTLQVRRDSELLELSKKAISKPINIFSEEFDIDQSKSNESTNDFETTNDDDDDELFSVDIITELDSVCNMFEDVDIVPPELPQEKDDSGPLKNTFLLEFEQSKLNSSVPYLQSALQREGVKVVSFAKDDNKKKKVILVGNGAPYNKLINKNIIDYDAKGLIDCAVCKEKFSFSNSYVVHYLMNHVKYKDEQLFKKPCMFCYTSFFHLRKFVDHLTEKHEQHISSLMVRDYAEQQKWTINPAIKTIVTAINEGTSKKKILSKPPQNKSAASTSVVPEPTSLVAVLEKPHSERKEPERKDTQVYFRPIAKHWLSKENEPVFISCGGLKNDLYELSLDLNKCSYIRKVYALPRDKESYKRIIFLGSQNVTSPLLPSLEPPSSDIDFSCVGCSLKFKDEETYKLHFYYRHNSQCPSCDFIPKSWHGLRSHYFKTHSKRYACEKCNRHFSNQAMYDAHKDLFKDSPTCHLKCETCGEKFTNRLRLDIHLKNHTTLKLCELCGKEFKTNFRLYSHKRYVHRKLEKTVCPFCGKFYTTESIKGHMQRHKKKERTHMCDQCPKKYYFPGDLRKHMVRHNKNAKRPYCDLCDTYFAFGYSVNTHKKLYHLRQAQFKCEICNEEFVRKDYLNNHKRMHVKYGVNWKCNRLGPFPGKKYRKDPSENNATENSPGKKTKKKQTRKNDKKYVSCAPVLCNICNKVVSAAIYKSHYNKHVNYRPFKCGHCPLKFSLKANMTRHQKLHSDPMYNLSCRICFNKFKTDSLLKEHMKKHMNKLRYECNLCRKRFGRRYLLEVHKENDHTELKEQKESILELALRNVIRIIPKGKEHEYVNAKEAYSEADIQQFEEENTAIKKLVEEFKEQY